MLNSFKLVAVYSLEEERAKCTWLEADVVDRLSVRSSNLSDYQLPVKPPTINCYVTAGS